MDSKEEPNANRNRRDTEAENSETVALNKKRARRVSFAENTSVHFFDRDEEFNETSQVEAAKMADDLPAEFGFGGLSERSKEFGGEDDGGDNLEDEIMEMQRSFLRPIGSPSSGGSTLGSASSNDEDHFFGPVSANFIRPGRLSDSAASDDNHDLTMDSTAFSMHFRSLAGSEPGIDLKTPTGGQLFFEEKTPTDSNKWSFMGFTLGKKHVPKSSVPATGVSENRSSNDMSLVGENPNKYDYEKLSPGVDAILAESRKNLLYVIASDDITSVSPKRNIGQVMSSVDHGNDLVNLNDSVGKENERINSNNMLNEHQSDARIQFGDANGSHGNFLGGCSPKRSTNTLGVAASNRESHKPNRLSYQSSKDEFESSLVGSTSSPVKRQQTPLTTAFPSKPWEVTSPLPEKLGSLLRNGSIEHRETETSLQKSISKLELLEKAAFSSVFSAKVDKSTIKSLDFFKSPNAVGKNHDISRISFMEDSVSEEKLASVNGSTERNFASYMDHARGENLFEKSSSQTMNGKSPNALNAKSIPAGKSNSGPTAASPSKNTWSGNNLIQRLITSNLNHEDSLMTETESLLAEIAFSEGEKAITPISVHSPNRVLDDNLPASPGLLSRQSVDLHSRFRQMANFDKGPDSTPGRDPADVNSSATDSIRIVSGGMNGELRSPFVEVGYLTELRATNNRETDMHNGKEIIQTTDNFSTPAKENQFQVVHLDRVLDDNLPASPGLLSSQSVDLHSRFRQMANFGKGPDSTPGRDPAHVNSSATDSIRIVSEGMNGELRSPFVEVGYLTELRAANNRETDMHNGKEIIQTTDNFSTPAKENQFQVVHLDRVLDDNLPASPGLLSSQSVDLHSRFRQMANFDKGPDSTPGRDPAHVNSSATDSIRIVSEGMNGELRSPFVEVSYLTELRATNNRETDMHNGKEIIQTTDNFSTPAKENQFQVVHLDVGDLTNRDISSFEDNIQGAESRMVSHESVSPSAYKNLDQPRLQFPAGSPSRKEPDDKQLSRIPSPRTIQMNGGLENYSANKRNIGLLLRDPQHRAEITKLGRSPKLLKSGNYDPEKIVYSIDNRTKLYGQEKQRLADAYYKFTEDMKIPILGSADKLSSKMIDVLEEMLVHQQRLKVYEMLQHGVVPQNAIVRRDLQLEKIAETKSLLQRVVFEKTKLQLKHVKRERLLKRQDLLGSRMQDSQTLRANMASLPLGICTSTVGAVGHRLLSVNLSKEHEVCHDKLTTMRQALEGLERKILTLTRTFHSCCKLKAEPGVGETITMVTENLAKKTSCRFIRLDVQMWVVQGVANLNGQHNVILNYLDLIMQSIKIIVGPTSSVRSSFKLNETNITKNFPNMDACIAFGFVFNTETAHKYAGVKTLQQETQVTSSLLGSLVDVVEEVQTAKIEFQNLTQSSFSSPSVDRLDLMLCFFNFNSGRKVSITFDLSCLKRGIYPSEILPLQLSSPTDSCTNLSSGIILDKIRDAVKDVRTGYMRILRLCRCVSQIVRTLTA